MATCTGLPELRDEACIALQRPAVGGELPCRACADACPTIAIFLSERELEIDTTACHGCGRCTAVCPTGALAIPGFMPPSAEPSARILECSRVSPDDQLPGSSMVRCLAGVREAYLRKRATAGDVTLIDRGWCAACPVARTASPWSDAIACVNGELEALHHPHRIRIQREAASTPESPPRPTAEDTGVSRRALLHRLTRPRTTTSRGAGAPSCVDSEALVQRRRALETLAGETPLPATVFAQITLSGATLQPQLASAVCPTGALEFERSRDSERLSFDAALCIACRACEPAGLQVHAHGSGSYTGRRTLQVQSMRRCTQCSMPFSPQSDEQRCKACARDRILAAEAHALSRRRPQQDTAETSLNTAQLQER